MAKTASIAYRLRDVTGRLVRHLRALEPKNGVTWSQLSLLSRLERDGETTAAALAMAEGIRPQSTAASLELLEAEKLITRRADPNDKRQLRVQVSDRGRELMKRSRATREEWLARAIAANLSRQEQELLGEAITLIERLVAE